MKTKAKRNRGCTSGYPRIYPLGDSALLIQLGSEIDDRINNRVLALERRLISLFPSFVRATVPAYVSLTIHYDPCQVNSEEFQTSILQQLDAVVGSDSPQGKLIKVPVVYGGEGGPDLPFVADHCGLSVAEVIRRHSQPEYRVHFIGFLPGFPYLGGMDPRLETPRLATPRTEVKAGSVGIAGGQTGIYPLDSPGGWRIIGWTPLKLFDITKELPVLLAPGDRVQFVPARTEDLPHA